MDDKERFLRLDEVIEKTGLKKSTIYDKIKRGEFPKSIAIGKGSVAWLNSEVKDWMKSKIDLREGEQ